MNKRSIAEIDLRPLSKHTGCPQYRKFFLNTDFKERYQFLHTSTHASRARRFSISVRYKGYSALALSYNSANRFISYNIADYKALVDPEKLLNIEYRIGHALEAPELLTSPLILLDTDHDGTFEMQVYNLLKDNGYKGLMVLDDIHLNEPMKHFWHRIAKPKQDITDIGHWSGTGIVNFDSHL